MIRRNARLRREYMYRKSLEGKERALYERKKQVRKALEEGTRIPTELRGEEADLRADLQFDDALTEAPASSIDDEYRHAGIRDPKVLVTTSRNPSSRLTQFASEMRLMFPNAQRINRGATVVKELVDACRSNDVTDLVIVHEHRGEPDGLIISHMPYGPTAYFNMTGCVLRHDIKDANLGTMSEAYPHLIFDRFDTPLGKRVQTILKYLFPVPKPDTKRVLSFVNRNDFISFRHHVYERPHGKDVELREVGPRFELRLYQIKLGTVDMKEAEDEWVLRPYMTTAHKRKAIG
ncbi:Brix domain-containing protein [Plasmodiophora brassicae]|nr:hypothetical protein PBRA_006619 [Plasmodiophora brassicae]